MKTLKAMINTLFIISISLFSVNSLVAAVTSMNMVPLENAKIFDLKVSTTGIGEIKITIKNESGKSIFDAYHPSLTSFVKRINLTDEKKGNYIFELEDEISVTKKTLVIEEDRVYFLETDSPRIYKPFFILDRRLKRLDFNWLLADYTDTKVRIFNPESSVDFTTIVKNQFKIGKRFDLGKIPSGTYMVIVSNEFGTFNKTFEL